MTLSDLGSIANLLSAVTVLATLVYLARQVKQGNVLARAQARQRMVEQANEELYVWMNSPDLRECFTGSARPTREQQAKMHYFLLAAMRAREWEWFQLRDGVIKEEVYRAYHEVIALHLGVPRSRKWWETVGRIGFDPAFVAEVDRFLADKPIVTYFDDIHAFDTPNSPLAEPPAGDHGAHRRKGRDDEALPSQQGG